MPDLKPCYDCFSRWDIGFMAYYRRPIKLRLGLSHSLPVSA